MSVRHEVNFDLSTFYLKERGLELNNYNLDRRIRVRETRPPVGSMLSRKLSFTPPKHFSRTYFEKSFHFSSEAIAHPIKKSYFGYFQSPKYFSEFSSEIKRIFTLSRTSNTMSKLQESIDFTESVAIHIRRGDYVGKEKFHGLSTEKYFRNALDLIHLNNSQKKIVVFSEDYLMAKSIFPEAWKIITPEILNSPSENLALMSRFENFIGSNSSFSWWSAFLSEKREGLNIFPRPWFSDVQFNDRDLLMPNWITLGNDGTNAND